ncbi:ATP-binding protein [Amycolatopsis sp. GM8]|uniref:ATP-binding protein n=1 Tax=Amycolatopsis sp. GM8 TaxID=2896530 RepID=UPI001F1D00C8|nr:ATP-binding protein [Amycolatopsis sp. GM8]
MSDHHLQLDLAPGQVPPLVSVRRWAAHTLPVGRPRLVADVQLVATELVTNAFDHAGGAVGIRLAYEPARGRLIVEVDDPSDEPPKRRSAGVSAFRGRGLVLVEGIATAWGCRARPGGGKTVWALLDV